MHAHTYIQLDSWATNTGRVFGGAAKALFGDTASDEQQKVITTLVNQFTPEPESWEATRPLSNQALAGFLKEEKERLFLLELLVVIEMCGHNPITGPTQAMALETMAEALDVDHPVLLVSRDAALEQLELMERDWNRFRPGGYVAASGVVDGSFVEGLASITNCASGTFGAELCAFYRRHGHPLPGEENFLIDELVEHDSMHVLAEIGTNPEEEIALQAFLCASFPSLQRLSGMIAALCLYELGSMRSTFGLQPERTVLKDETAQILLAEAFARGSQVNGNLYELNPLAELDTPIARLREKWGVPQRESDPHYASELAAVNPS